MFDFNPLSNPQAAELYGLSNILPNVPNTQQQTGYQSMMPVQMQATPTLDMTTVQGLTDAINAMTAASQQQQLQIEKQHIENTLLRNNIQSMKTNKVYSRHFIDTVDGIAMCTETDGLRNTTTTIGIISITSAQTYRIPNKGVYTVAVLVKYTDSNRNQSETIVTEEEISSKNLLKKFHGFEYQCKNKQLANDYLANRINRVNNSCVITLYEHAGFYPYTREDSSEKAYFNCNSGDVNSEILKLYPDCVLSKKLIQQKNDIVEIQKNAAQYLHTPEKCLVYVFSVCGLLSTMLQNIGYKPDQYLLISAPDFNCSKQASMYLKVYDRETIPFSFDDTKKSIVDYISTAKDETFVITDCSNIDNKQRRNDILSMILTLEKQSLPHNTAIISTSAQFTIPSEKKICLSLSKDFSPGLSQIEEHTICDALNEMTRHFIDYVCNNYGDIKSLLNEKINEFMTLSEKFSFPNIQSRTSWCILLSVFCILAALYQLPVPLNDMAVFIFGLFKDNEIKTGNDSDAIINDFINALNNMICDNEVSIIEYAKDMNFMSDTHQIIIDDEKIAMEESLITDIILPRMTTTNSVHRILKSLDSDNLLYTSSKGDKQSLRYKMTVNNRGHHMRLSFIVIKKDSVLSNSSELICSSLKDAEWFSNTIDDKIIPVITDHTGRIAGQTFSHDDVNNLHLFTTGVSGKGKTHYLTERMCSLQKKGIRTVIFDISDSFTKESIIRNLSTGGNDEVRRQVETYVSDHITFHKIETNGIPVEPLKLNYNGFDTTAQNIISAIVKSHLGKLGCKQAPTLEENIRLLIDSGDLSAVNMYDILTTDYAEDQMSLQLQMRDCLSCFVDFECADRDWDTFFQNSKDIIIISMDASSKPGGYALIDFLMMSLFQHQCLNSEKSLAIFVDEIQNQNLKENSPIYQILRLGRKYRVGLNYATQFLSKSSKDTNSVLEMANISVYFQPDNASMASVAKNLGLPKKELNCMNVGECYIKGDIYNYEACHSIGTILHGYTHRNFIPFNSK